MTGSLGVRLVCKVVESLTPGELSRVVVVYFLKNGVFGYLRFRKENKIQSMTVLHLFLLPCTITYPKTALEDADPLHLFQRVVMPVVGLLEGSEERTQLSGVVQGTG